MCMSRNTCSITPCTMSTIAAGQTKSSRKRPKNRTEFASSLAAEAFLTHEPEFIRSAMLLLRSTRELDEFERAKASAGSISIQSRFLRESNIDPDITEKERTELLRHLYQDRRRSGPRNPSTRDDTIAGGIGAADLGAHTDHQVERVHDSYMYSIHDPEQHKNNDDQPSSPASSIGKKRKIHEISGEAWLGRDSRHRKKVKRDSKMHSVASRTA